MASRIELVAAELRRRILSGELAPGERIREQEFAPLLGVSRTPLRVALSELETQGLVEVIGKRGFQVRGITLEQITEAIDVRGVLEGFAARLVAERGLNDETRHGLLECLEEGRTILEESDQACSEVDIVAWVAMNARFHRILLDGAENSTLRSALEHISKVPLTAAGGALSFSGSTATLEASFLRRSQADHEDVVSALLNREGTRAEALMREHASRSRDNKRLLVQLAGPLATEDQHAAARKKPRRRSKE